MYTLDFIDEFVLEHCNQQIKRIYPEFRAFPLGVSKDKKAVIYEIEFPDGTFYFRVDESSVSAAYRDRDAADRG